MVAGIGLMVGMAASRFLKASSERRYDSTQARPYTSRYSYGSPSAGVADYETVGRETSWGGESRGD
jgi:hypothetical protein